MQTKPELIKLSDIERSLIPLGYTKIYIKEIPSLKVEKKLMLYNEKYEFTTTQLLIAAKPISKILK